MYVIRWYRVVDTRNGSGSRFVSTQARPLLVGREDQAENGRMNRPVGFGMDGPLKRSYLEDFWCFAVSSVKEIFSCSHVWPRHGRQGGGDGGSTAR